MSLAGKGRYEMPDNCRWTERTADYDEICDQPADAGEIFLKASNGSSVTVPVCKRHKAIHNQRAAALRAGSEAKS